VGLLRCLLLRWRSTDDAVVDPSLPVRRRLCCAGPDRLGENEKLHAEIWLTRACVRAAELAAFATFVGLDVPSLESGRVLAFVYVLLVSGLVYGGLVYQVSRLSCLRRVRAFARRCCRRRCRTIRTGGSPSHRRCAGS